MADEEPTTKSALEVALRDLRNAVDMLGVVVDFIDDSEHVGILDRSYQAVEADLKKLEQTAGGPQ